MRHFEVLSCLPEDAGGFALQKACPFGMEMPMGGFHFLAVRLIQERDWPDILDKFLPAKLSLGRYFNERWANCNKEQGISKDQ